MAKFYGIIGYASQIESSPGVWEDTIIEKKYSGDLIKNFRRNQFTETIHDDINISNEISILADPFAFENSSTIRYVTFMGAKWKVSNIDVQYPRLILTIGGVYNG